MISRRRGRRAGILGTLCLVEGSWRAARRPSPRSARTWSGSGTRSPRTRSSGRAPAQIEALIYLSYTQLAVYDAVVAIEGGYEPYGPAIVGTSRRERRGGGRPGRARHARATTSRPAPRRSTRRATRRSARSSTAPPDRDGTRRRGRSRATRSSRCASGDGRPDPVRRRHPPFRTRRPPPASGGSRRPRTPPPQIPWTGDVTPFVTASADQFRPAPPPALSSAAWVADFNEVKRWARAHSTVRTTQQTAIARFYTANVPRQWNRWSATSRTSESLGLLETARLAAMINTVGADAGIAVMNAKYHYLFWRPVDRDRPDVGAGAGDGFGPTPGFDDGNPATVEQAGWRPLITTPNHPEYPAAHGTITSAIAEVLTQFKGTSKIDVDIHGADSATNNLNRRPPLRQGQPAARATSSTPGCWGGVHYRTSTEAGVDLGRSVAKYDLKHAFEAGALIRITPSAACDGAAGDRQPLLPVRRSKVTGHGRVRAIPLGDAVDHVAPGRRAPDAPPAPARAGAARPTPRRRPRPRRDPGPGR